MPRSMSAATVGSITGWRIDDADAAAGGAVLRGGVRRDWQLWHSPLQRLDIPVWRS
jgi:hypothetical protein